MPQNRHIVLLICHSRAGLTHSVSNVYGTYTTSGRTIVRMRFETTIQRSCEVSGVGLHSGVPVHMRLTPAPAGTGIVFRRSDLDFFPVAASWKHVARVIYATSLMRQGVLISTIEHLLSTLYSFAIDNAYVEIDNLEVPILDGSGKPFVDLLRAAGRRQLRRQRKYLRIRPASDR